MSDELFFLCMLSQGLNLPFCTAEKTCFACKFLNFFSQMNFFFSMWNMSQKMRSNSVRSCGRLFQKLREMLLLLFGEKNYCVQVLWGKKSIKVVSYIIAVHNITKRKKQIISAETSTHTNATTTTTNHTHNNKYIP